MAAGLEKRSFLDKTKEWGVKATAVVAIGAGAMFLAGCGPSKSGADHVPTSPSISAPATPGSSETSSPAPSETSQSPEAKETVLTNSEVYNAMTPADQALVEKDAKLSFDQFEQLDWNERAKVALVLMDANSAPYIQAAGELVLPGNLGKPLKDIYVPATGQHINVAQSDYDYALKSTPDMITVAKDNTPYLYAQYAEAISFNIAKSGNPQLLEDAKKILGGTVYWEVSKSDAADGDLQNKIQKLEQVASSKSDSDQFLHFPQASVASHYFTNYTDGPNKGKPNEVFVGFQTYDPTSQQFVDGPNEDGMVACGYMAAPFTLKDGTQQAGWVIHQCTDGQSIGVGGFPINSLQPDHQ